jgi:hypothetical protein
MGGARIVGGGDGDGDGEGADRVSRTSIRVRIRSVGGDGLRSLSTILSRTIRTGEGLRSLSITLSRKRIGDGDRSRILSLVSVTRARSLSGLGERSISRSLSIILVRTLSGVGDLSTILSRNRTGLGDLGRRSKGRVKVSVSLSRKTSGPPSVLP